MTARRNKQAVVRQTFGILRNLTLFSLRAEYLAFSYPDFRFLKCLSLSPPSNARRLDRLSEEIREVFLQTPPVSRRCHVVSRASGGVPKRSRESFPYPSAV